MIPIRVISVGGPYFDGRLPARALRGDVRNINVEPGLPNTLLFNFNEVDLAAFLGSGVRLLKASNVAMGTWEDMRPDVAYVDADHFAAQARALGVEHVVATTGQCFEQTLKMALERNGFEVRIRRRFCRNVVTARRRVPGSGRA